MEFSEFKDAIVEVMTKEGYKVDITEIKRADGTEYTGLRKVGVGITPIVNLEALYDLYCAEGMYSAVLKAREIFNKPDPCNIHAEDFIVWDKVKDMLLPRLVPDNKVYEDKPGVKVADLKVIFSILAFVDADGVGMVTVDCPLLNMWGKSTDEVYAKAMENLENEEYEVIDFGPFTVVTNPYKTKGAIECLNPKAAHLFEGNYIIPSSVDEVLILNGDNLNMEVEDMVEMVKMVNEDAVNPEDRLSDNVYRLVDGRLEVV